ncbi:MAG: hypothetical protein QNJ36_09045 [Calothrix sp. MO_167.B42]|nr:hypothetical protein [Calothrix sp. MO_167.B42]
MTQPTYGDLFGTGANFNESTQKIEIPLSALASAGLNATNPTAVNALAAIIKNSHGWLDANQDEQVMATASLESIAPVPRNEIDKTEFSYTLNFYGNYQAPTFDPDEV